MDNRVFDVNGDGIEDLTLALTLAFHQQGHNTKCVGWSQSRSKGLVLYWSPSEEKTFHPMVTPLKAEEVAVIVQGWLTGEFAKTVEPKDNWDVNIDHDGHNTLGWRVYCEEWGHVDGSWRSICAIKPVYLWHGK